MFLTLSSVICLLSIKLTKIKRFEDLKVWQLSHQLSLDVAALEASFPRDEKYDLCNQMRRSARSVPSEISEGFGRFHFNDKLTFYERARSSLSELRNHFKEAYGNNYIDEILYESYCKRMKEIGYLLTRMMSGIKRARDLHNTNKNKSSRRTIQAKG